MIAELVFEAEQEKKRWLFTLSTGDWVLSNNASSNNALRKHQEAGGEAIAVFARIDLKECDYNPETVEDKLIQEGIIKA